MITYKSFDEFKEHVDNVIVKMYNFTILKYNEDYSIDVDGDVRLYSQQLTSIPIKFNIVTGDFNCSFNHAMTSLEGCPEYIGGDFICAHNRFISLKGSPKFVNGNCNCSCNKLISLEGCPKYVGGYFYCYSNNSNNKLTTLEGSPEYVGGDFDCSSNKTLQSLEGAPEIIRGKWNIEKKYHSYPEYQRYLLVKKIEKL